MRSRGVGRWSIIVWIPLAVGLTGLGFAGQEEPADAHVDVFSNEADAAPLAIPRINGPVTLARKPFYVAPYLLGGGERVFSLNEAESAYSRDDQPTYEAGLDVKYGLTSNLTFDLTLNTDFAQVELDDQQINLTRFSLFFPEKRIFFQKRSSIFDFGFGESNRLFHSRRIGIHEGSPVRIYGGARLVGRLGAWDVGMLDMQTSPFEDLSSENFGVFRMRRQVINPYSYVGGIVTSRIGAGGEYNTAYGLDGIFRLFGHDYLELKWVQTFDDGGSNDLTSLDPARIYLNWERRTFDGFAYALNYSRAGPAYDPGLGFEIRGVQLDFLP